LAARIKLSILEKMIKKIFSILSALECDSQIVPVKQGCLREGETTEQGLLQMGVGIAFV
jgi:hypothetical protein